MRSFLIASGFSFGSYYGKSKWSKKLSAAASSWLSWSLMLSYCSSLTSSCLSVSSDKLSLKRPSRNFASSACFLFSFIYWSLFLIFFIVESMFFLLAVRPFPSSKSTSSSPTSPPNAFGSKCLGNTASGGGILFPLGSYFFSSGFLPPIPKPFARPERFLLIADKN